VGKTLLIGLDGATFGVLDPLIERGVMPTLAGIVDRGVRAPLRSVVPPLTPPAWTSLMTGKQPGEHGVFDFFQKETPDSEYFQFASSRDVRASTIWSLAGEQGRRVISLNFPLMFPPPPVNGYVVPGGWVPWRQLRLGCHPPGLFDRLKALPSFEPRELALDMKLEAKAIEGCDAEEYADWIRLHSRREERWFDIVRHLLAEDEHVDLVGVMFDGPDKLQHLCWRFIDQATRPKKPTAWEGEIIALCDEYFRRLDSIIAELVALTGPDPTVVLASDHGFGPSWDVFYVNAWLEQHGYLSWADQGEREAVNSTQVGFSRMTRHVFELDWRRTVAYAATPSSHGIHIVRQQEGSDARMTDDDYERLTADIAEGLLQVRSPRSDRPLVKEVHFRTETFAGPYEQLAPDLSLGLADGAAISILRSETLVKTRREPNGNHRPEGVFVAAGPGLRSGEMLPELSIVDVAPLLLYSLGVAVPLDMSGRLPEAAFRPGELERRPPQYVAAGLREEAIGANEPDIVFDADDEALIVNRLRALGYVE
jgi:predicted AlkP superfamily phosphohydrolase/phosphomutase